MASSSLTFIIVGMIAGLTTITSAFVYIGVPGNLVSGFFGGSFYCLTIDYIELIFKFMML